MLNLTGSTVIDVLRRVISVRNRWKRATKAEVELWFRGVGSTRHTLTPGAYRKPQFDEESMVNEFEQLAPSYFAREPTNDWDWYFLMQHHRLATRLLDWTENPLVALYFALESWATERAKHDGRVPDPCVWMLDPGWLNMISTGGIDDGPIIPGGDFSNHWLSRQCGNGKSVCAFEFEGKNYTNAKPLAILPKRREPRILAQQGMFTVHGADRDPLESCLHKNKGDRIARIRLRNPALTAWQDDLKTLGVSHAALFPEPDSIARDLRRRYGI